MKSIETLITEYQEAMGLPVHPDATMSGVGVGLNWFGPDQWSARLTLATPVGAEPQVSGVSRNTRAWVAINKGF